MLPCVDVPVCVCREVYTHKCVQLVCTSIHCVSLLGVNVSGGRQDSIIHCPALVHTPGLQAAAPYHTTRHYSEYTTLPHATQCNTLQTTSEKPAHRTPHTTCHISRSMLPVYIIQHHRQGLVFDVTRPQVRLGEGTASVAQQYKKRVHRCTGIRRFLRFVVGI